MFFNTEDIELKIEWVVRSENNRQHYRGREELHQTLT